MTDLDYDEWYKENVKEEEILCSCGNDTFKVKETTPIGSWVIGRFVLHCMKCHKITERTVVE